MFAKLVNRFRGRRCEDCEHWAKLGTDVGSCRLCPDFQLSGDDVACRDFVFRRPPPPPPLSLPSYASLGLSLGLAALARYHDMLVAAGKPNDKGDKTCLTKE